MENLNQLENLNLVDVGEYDKNLLPKDYQKYYFNKYIKYKFKFINLKKFIGGDNHNNNHNIIKAIAFFNTTTNTNINTIKGTVLFEEIPNDLINVIIDLTGFEPNSIHGFHVHESGDLSKGCDSMCAHFNPFNSTHGGRKDDIKLRHVGDLGNIIADSNGCVQINFTDHLIKLRGDVANIIGRGLIIHEGEDDCGKTSHELSKTTGNSGKRIACAIIGYSSKCAK